MDWYKNKKDSTNNEKQQSKLSTSKERKISKPKRSNQIPLDPRNTSKESSMSINGMNICFDKWKYAFGLLILTFVVFMYYDLDYTLGVASLVLNTMEPQDDTTVKEMENDSTVTGKNQIMNENDEYLDFEMEYNNTEDQFEKEYDDNEDVETTATLKNLPDDAKVHQIL